jgi:hypothetical protein
VAKHAEKEIDLKEEIEKAKLIRRMKLEEEERERQEREKRRKRSRSRSRGRRWAPFFFFFFQVLLTCIKKCCLNNTRYEGSMFYFRLGNFG